MNDPALRVLLVQEDTAFALRVLRRLASDGEGEPMELDRSASLEEGLERLDKGDVHAVLLDLELPDAPGLDAVARVCERSPEVPVVALTKTNDEGWALGALLSGAQDHVAKEPLPSAAELRRVIRNALARQRVAREGCRRSVERAQMASLSVLCAGLGAGLNELVGRILEETDAAVRTLPERGAPKELRQRLTATQGSALRAARIAEQLRDYAAEHRRPAHPLDLSQFLLDTASSLDVVAGRAPVHYDLPAAVPVVMAGRLPLYRVLMGLVRNAAEALEGEPGRIVVSTGLLRADAELLDASPGFPGLAPGVHAFLRVADDGRGMDPAQSERIFEPFYTTKAAGRGLGLACALGIVRGLRGRIHVRTAPGAGSTFTVMLPLH